jgi:hypothetical protein
MFSSFVFLSVLFDLFVGYIYPVKKWLPVHLYHKSQSATFFDGNLKISSPPPGRVSETEPQQMTAIFGSSLFCVDNLVKTNTVLN